MEPRPNLRKYLALLVPLALVVALLLPAAATAAPSTGITAAINDARRAGVSEETVNQVLAFGYEYHLDPSTVKRFLNIMAKAAGEGLPVAPLVSKTKEGLVKRVPPSRILSVLQKEISNQVFVRKLAQTALKRWKQPLKNLTPRLLTRMSRTLQMGITKSEMEYFFAHAPRAPMSQVADALEFLAALKQAPLNARVATRLVFSGLKTGFFAKTAWQVPLMVRFAKKKSVSEDKIAAAAMDVVSRKSSVGTACKSLGLDTAALAQGPQFSASPSAGETGPGISGRSHGEKEGSHGTGDRGETGFGADHGGGDHGGGEAGGEHGGAGGGEAGGGHGGSGGGDGGGGHGGDSGGGDHGGSGGGEAGGGHGGGGEGGGGGGEGGH